ncbi:MAG: hypothetical protein ACRDTR_01640 [Rubrobacter sp.]
MSEPEFYANATLGFRQWRLRTNAEGDEPPRLEALTRFGWTRFGMRNPQHRYLWDLSGPNRAECGRIEFKLGSSSSVAHGEAPEARCSCGFYAHGRRDASNSETMVHVVGGVVAGWGNVELYEGGFRCGVAKVLALFAPDPAKWRSDYDGVAHKTWAALGRVCAEHGVPLLEPETLREDEEVRRYAYERDLALLEDQLNASVPTW